MRQVKDTNGNAWDVLETIEGPAARRAQIYPGYSQVNVQRNGRQLGLQLPNYIAQQWLAGKIRLSMRGAE